MIPIEPAELSALLDGELSARRADEVRQAIAADPSRCGQYQQLADLDVIWRSAADRAAFKPAASLGKVLFRSRMRLLFAIVILLIWRISIKMLPLPIALVVETIGLAIGLWWGARRLLRPSAVDRWEVSSAWQPE